MKEFFNDDDAGSSDSADSDSDEESATPNTITEKPDENDPFFSEVGSLMIYIF